MAARGPGKTGFLLTGLLLAGPACAGLFALAACVPEEGRREAGPLTRSRVVSASAYNSTPAQTSENPTLTAWGDTLRPGMKAVAVSRDLIRLGLTHGTRVRVEGLEGDYIVRDKMADRWTEKIDIYMGDDVDAAREWGVREVTIRWSDIRD